MQELRARECSIPQACKNLAKWCKDGEVLISQHRTALSQSYLPPNTQGDPDPDSTEVKLQKKNKTIPLIKDALRKDYSYVQSY